MRQLSFSIALFFYYGADAQLSTSIYWTEQTSMPKSEIIYFNLQNPLAWNDFKGTPDETSIAAAITVSGFGYKAEIKNSGTKGQLNIGVYCYFDKNTSWVKPGKTTSYILIHEQQHFNISYIAACLFVEKLKSVALSFNNFNTIVPALYKESCDKMNKMQDDYDVQTKNGQLKDMQAKWDEYLSKKISTATK